MVLVVVFISRVLNPPRFLSAYSDTYLRNSLPCRYLVLGRWNNESDTTPAWLVRFMFHADEECILSRSCNKNQLHEALENNDFEAARRLIASSKEADLVECFEGREIM